MKKSSLFTKQFILTLLATFGFSLLGFAVSFYFVARQVEDGGARPGAMIAELYLKLEERLSAAEAIKVIIPDPKNSKEGLGLKLLDEQANILLESDDRLLPPRVLESLPSKKGDIQRLGGPAELIEIVNLGGAPARFLLIHPPQIIGEHVRPATLLLFLLSSAILSALVSIGVLFIYLRKNALEIASIMSRLKQGDLKARLKVKKLDELGQVMVQFNEMVDELEKLMDQVRISERARVEVLQSLGHDFRTPIASLKTMLETLERKDQIIDARKRKDMLEVALSEVGYLARLVDDLLFLAFIENPQNSYRGSSIKIYPLLKNELSRMEASLIRPTRLDLQADQSLQELSIFGDEHLLCRLFRNALDNACSFAQGRVDVLISMQGHDLNIEFHDNGPGMSEVEYGLFGKNRTPRTLKDIDAVGGGKRISLGLGAVIMREIVEAHGGKLSARPSHLGGACISCLLPLKFDQNTSL